MKTVSGDLAAQIREALRIVIDPELGHNIVDLGFIYDITAEDDGMVGITMTTTTPGCPATGFLKDGVATSALGVAGVQAVDVTLSYDPPWTPALMSPEAKAELGFADGWN
ncbi:MAG TPA: metal-sulfur cluster assembly factor [Tardiphaga sp.]|jgi:metal-sulfur cluster biosynthetic enzyme